MRLRASQSSGQHVWLAASPVVLITIFQKKQIIIIIIFQLPVPDPVVVYSSNRFAVLDASPTPCVLFEFTPIPSRFSPTSYHNFQSGLPSVGQQEVFRHFQVTYRFSVMVEIDGECISLCLSTRILLPIALQVVQKNVYKTDMGVELIFCQVTKMCTCH